MRFAINLPNFGVYGDPRLLAELAHEADDAGWDGFFIWDHIQFFVPGQPVPLVDPWVALSAVAMTTSRIRFGPMVTPIPRRRPWKLAREATTLDHLSGGRLILGVGLGDPAATEFGALGEPTDPVLRAEMLDEGLEILTGLWTGEPLTFHGKHFQLENVLFHPTPLQTPRIPIWVAGFWPNKRPFRRAARWDGVFPGKMDNGRMSMMTPAEVREMAAYIGAHRQGDGPFDIVVGGRIPDDPARAADFLADYAEAGVTWWQEGVPDASPGTLDTLRAMIRRGPPASGR